MSNIILVPFEQKDLAILEKWFEDAEHLRWMGNILPLERWYKYISTYPHYRTWLGYEGQTVVGMLELQINPGPKTGEVGLSVTPELRYKGYGRRLLKLLFEEAEVAALRYIWARIERENEPSQRCFRAVGFYDRYGEPDPWDKLIYLRYNLQATPEYEEAL